jgi:hypothetical protein
VALVLSGCGGGGQPPSLSRKDAEAALTRVMQHLPGRLPHPRPLSVTCPHPHGVGWACQFALSDGTLGHFNVDNRNPHVEITVIR